MNARISALALACLAMIAQARPASAQEDGKSASPRKKVLVELYTSQGCNSCPSANEFLGQLAGLGYGPDRVVPVAFHVDYFNEPWADPFSSKDHSRRQLAYNSVQKRNDLYFTPMMMVDGRHPMLGSNRPTALAALGKALKEDPGVSLDMTLKGEGSDRALTAKVRPLAAASEGRQIMVGVTLTEGPITTRVPSGENAGRALVEPFVVRSFAFQTGKLDRGEARVFSFPLRLAPGAVAAKTRVSAWVQDWDDGRVHQAESIAWEKPTGTVSVGSRPPSAAR